MTVTGHYFRENDGSKGEVGSPEVIEQKKRKSKGEKSIRCGHCGRTVTSITHRIDVDGSHQHTFFNPAGIVYEICCFSEAPGCLENGPPSQEFSWFKGFSWRFALCSGCFSHLGWAFQSTGFGFFGLIGKKLIQ